MPAASSPTIRTRMSRLLSTSRDSALAMKFPIGSCGAGRVATCPTPALSAGGSLLLLAVTVPCSLVVRSLLPVDCCVLLVVLLQAACGLGRQASCPRTSASQARELCMLDVRLTSHDVSRRRILSNWSPRPPAGVNHARIDAPARAATTARAMQVQVAKCKFKFRSSTVKCATEHPASFHSHSFSNCGRMKFRVHHHAVPLIRSATPDPRSWRVGLPCRGLALSASPRGAASSGADRVPRLHPSRMQRAARPAPHSTAQALAPPPHLSLLQPAQLRAVSAPRGCAMIVRHSR